MDVMYYGISVFAETNQMHYQRRYTSVSHQCKKLNAVEKFVLVDRHFICVGGKKSNFHEILLSFSKHFF